MNVQSHLCAKLKCFPNYGTAFPPPVLSVEETTSHFLFLSQPFLERKIKCWLLVLHILTVLHLEPFVQQPSEVTPVLKNGLNELCLKFSHCNAPPWVNKTRVLVQATRTQDCRGAPNLLTCPPSPSRLFVHPALCLAGQPTAPEPGAFSPLAFSFPYS